MRSISVTTTIELVADADHVLDRGRRGSRPARLMWTRPSLPGRISTKAPKFMMRVTLPRYSLPTSTSLVRPSIQAIAFWAASPLDGGDLDRAVVLDVDLRCRSRP